jgi:hypothetical protein
MNDFVMYHKEYAPQGHFFNKEEGQTEQSLAQEGWVDDPTKIRVNLWDEGAEKQVQQRAAAFERGEMKAIDDLHFQSEADIARAQQQLLKNVEREAFLRGEQAGRNEALQQQRSADAVADAERKAEHEPEAQIQVPVEVPVLMKLMKAELDGGEVDRKMLIKSALRDVDLTHAPNLTRDGEVRMEVLQAMLDFDPSADERDEAQAELDAEAANAL